MEKTWFLDVFCACFVNKAMVEFDKTGSKHRNRICQRLPPDLAPRSYGNQGEVQHQSHIDGSHRLPSNLISFSVNVPLFSHQLLLFHQSPLIFQSCFHYHFL
jgi:hypothetical protein